MKDLLSIPIACRVARLSTLAAALAVTATSHAQLVTYSENFEDETIGATTVTETTGGFSGSGGSITAVSANSGVPSASNSVTTTAAVAADDDTLRDFATSVNVVRAGAGSISGFTGAAGQFQNVAGSDFTYTGTVQLDALTITSGAVNAANFGLSFLAGTAADAINAGNRYTVLITAAGSTPGAGHLTLAETVTGATTNHVINTQGLSITAGTNYTFTITGTYATPGTPGSALTLNASVSDGTNTRTIANFVDNSPRTGSFFGYRTAMNINAAGNATLDVDYDNFSLSYTVVPEPGSASLLGLAACALLARRRRA